MLFDDAYVLCRDRALVCSVCLDSNKGTLFRAFNFDLHKRYLFVNNNFVN